MHQPHFKQNVDKIRRQYGVCQAKLVHDAVKTFPPPPHLISMKRNFPPHPTACVQKNELHPNPKCLHINNKIAYIWESMENVGN